MYRLAVLSIGCSVLAAGQGSVAVTKPVAVQGPEAGAVAFSSVTAPFVWGAMDAAPVVLNASPVTGAPYSAQSVTTQTQVLADGNRIQQKSTTNVARDSQGRMRIERSIHGPGGEEDLPKMVTIQDPVSGTNYSLDTVGKNAFKMPGKPMINVSTAGGPMTAASGTFTVATSGPGLPQLPPPPGVPGAPHMMIMKDKMNAADVTTTDLGSQTMEGVLVQGKRTTRTIPAGSIGNDREIVITSETWYSPDLQVMVSTKSEDPRIGETTYQLTNIQRSEPAASLFQVPSDYTVKDQPGNTFFYKHLDTK